MGKEHTAGSGGEVRRPPLIWSAGNVREEGMTAQVVAPAAMKPPRRDLQWVGGVEVAAVFFAEVDG